MSGPSRNRPLATRGLLLAVAVLAASAAAVLLLPSAQAIINTGATPMQLGAAMSSQPGLVTSASFLVVSGGPSTAVSDTALTVFPTDGTEYVILSSGSAASAAGPAPGIVSGSYTWGGDVNDLTVLRLELSVPQGHDCLTFDYQFLSEEYPDYVGAAVNDAFIAELDVTTWTSVGGVLTAPDNFAVDMMGNPLSVNTAGMNAANAQPGTIYGGATTLWRANKPVSPGAHVLFLSIFDATDDIFDSAAFVDNLHSFKTQDAFHLPCPPPPPEADFSWFFTGTSPADYDLDLVQFTNQSLFQIPGSARTFSWTLGVPGATSTLEDPTWTYMDDGVYLVCLSITESQGTSTLSDTECKPVTVNNRPPQVCPFDADVDSGGTLAMQPCGTDMDGSVTNWQWIISDGTALTVPSGSTWSIHQLTRSGIFRVCLFAIDNDGASSWMCRNVRYTMPIVPVKDTDVDGVADSSDNCSAAANGDQADSDQDGQGDACQEAEAFYEPPTAPQPVEVAGPVDLDNDGITTADNCPASPNVDQRDMDGDTFGDACDGDIDGDGLATVADLCPLVADDGQDRDADGAGDACQPGFDPGCPKCVARGAPLAASAEAAESNVPAGLAIAAVTMAGVMVPAVLVALRRRRER